MRNELIHVRLPAELVDDVRTAAKANHRTMAAEITHRLEAYVAQEGEATSYGYMKAEPEFEGAADRTLQFPAAFAELVEDAANKIATLFPLTGPIQPAYLGTLRDAVTLALNGLGATDPEDASEPISRAAWSMYQPMQAIKSGSMRPGGYTARLRKLLGFDQTKEA